MSHKRVYGALSDKREPPDVAPNSVFTPGLVCWWRAHPVYALSMQRVTPNELECHYGADHLNKATPDESGREAVGDVPVLITPAGEHGEDRAEDSNTQRRADHARRVEEARRGTAARGRCIGDGNRVHRSGIESQSTANDQQGSLDQEQAVVDRNERQREQVIAMPPAIGTRGPSSLAILPDSCETIAKATDSGSSSRPATSADSPRADCR